MLLLQECCWLLQFLLVMAAKNHLPLFFSIFFINLLPLLFSTVCRCKYLYPVCREYFGGLSQTYSLGIIAGLVIGKPLGILLFSFIAVGLGFCTLPAGLNWKRITGAGFLGGIGFTMSIFITLLAFDDTDIVNNFKIAILDASLIAGIGRLPSC